MRRTQKMTSSVDQSFNNHIVININQRNDDAAGINKVQIWNGKDHDDRRATINTSSRQNEMDKASSFTVSVNNATSKERQIEK